MHARTDGRFIAGYVVDVTRKPPSCLTTYVVLYCSCPHLGCGTPFTPRSRAPDSEHPRTILRVMSLQRLYDLDRWSTQFPGQLDELLHDSKYVDGFQKLPEGELVELIDYLNSVRGSQHKSDPTYCSHRSSNVSIPQAIRSESASTCCRRYVTQE